MQRPLNCFADTFLINGSGGLSDLQNPLHSQWLCHNESQLYLKVLMESCSSWKCSVCISSDLGSRAPSSADDRLQNHGAFSRDNISCTLMQHKGAFLNFPADPQTSSVNLCSVRSIFDPKQSI